MQFTIEKLIYGGDGLAHLPADERGQGKAVFVPFVLPGERVEASLAESKPGFSRARLDKVLEPGPGRVTPGCPYFGECGGCQYQHIAYEQQLQFKAEILRETLRRIAKVEIPGDIEMHPSPPWNYRNRTRMRVQGPQTRGTEGVFAIGYNRHGSHELLGVRECPISSPLINRALAEIWKLGEARKVPSGISEIEFFANADDSELLLEIMLSEETGDIGGVAEFARAVRSGVPQVAGVVPFHAGIERAGSTARPVKIAKEHADAFGANALSYRTRHAAYRVSAGAFFQTNRFLVDEMVDVVVRRGSDIGAGGFALDLYAGVGLFSLALSRNYRQVAAVESAAASFRDLKENAPQNVHGYAVPVDRFLAEVPAETRFDYVVVDPPRGGLGERVAGRVAGLRAPRLTYVSCDPATLARDLRVLTQAGYRIGETHVLDLFPQTFHIETVVHLSR